MRINRVIAIGDFDGVHRGHQAVFATLNDWADSLQAQPLVLSFDVNTKKRKVITEGPVRDYYFQQYGVRHWQTLCFEQLKEMNAQDFVQQVLKDRLGTVGVVAGPDLHFGKDRAGNEFTLISNGIAVKKIENMTREDLRISSSGIRQYLQEGNLAEAEAALGHPFTLMGTVCHGKGLAREFGLPTVNLSLSRRQLLPPYGVYAAWVYLDDIPYPAVANVGVRPTVEKTDVANLEAHILAQVPDLYGRQLRVELKAYLRREQTFDSKEQLFLQIKKDGEQSLKRLEMLQ